MNDHDAATYAMARHVPDMERGFTIHTSYGELWIEGDEAKRHPEVMDGILAILEDRTQQAKAVQS